MKVDKSHRVSYINVDKLKQQRQPANFNRCHPLKNFSMRFKAELLPQDVLTLFVDHLASQYKECRDGKSLEALMSCRQAPLQSDLLYV